MKALSVRQPWPSLMLLKIKPKRLEIRSWATDYRGDLLICASKEWDAGKFIQMGVPVTEAEEKYPTGVSICLVRLANCRPYLNTAQDLQDSGGVRWKRGLFAFELEDVEAVSPMQVRGQLGLFSVPLEISRNQKAAEQEPRRGQIPNMPLCQPCDNDDHGNCMSERCPCWCDPAIDGKPKAPEAGR